MKKVLIIEDEKDTRDVLAQMVEEIEPEVKVYEAMLEEQAYGIAMRNTIDVFILDVELEPKKPGGDCSGAEFAQRIRTVDKYRFTPIIVVTGYYDTKMMMFSAIHCYQFIEKPFYYEKVKETVREALKYHTEDGSERKKFYLFEGMLEAVDISDIIYARSMNQWLQIVTRDREITLRYKPCKAFLEELDSEDFIQCRRGTIVNRRYIQMVDPSNRYIHLRDCDEVLEIGPLLKRKFMDKLLERE